MQKQYIIGLVVIAVAGIIVFGTNYRSQMVDQMPSDEQIAGDLSDQVVTDVPTEFTGVIYSGLLEDVTSNGSASGVAEAYFDQTYQLTASMNNLPQLEGSDFYEGWIVRKEPFEFISTGVVEQVNGVYLNSFTDTRDLTDHDFYVLTLEPDDGDPAPAEHIVEGTMTSQ